VLRAPFGAVLFKSIARFSKFNRFEIVSEKSLKLTRDVVRGEHRTGGIIAVQYSFIFFRITMENNVVFFVQKFHLYSIITSRCSLSRKSWKKVEFNIRKFPCPGLKDLQWNTRSVFKTDRILAVIGTYSSGKSRQKSRFETVDWKVGPLAFVELM
jgi:hypothetical protein